MRGLLVALALCLAPWGAAAVEPSEILSDPVLEARAREISKDLRCLVCQNQSIDDSNADLARDLRVLVRERLVRGDTNDQVLEYVVSRYGDFVLLRPPFKASTYVLWFGPAFIFLLGVLALVLFFRRRASAPAGAAPLNEEEAARIEKLLDEGKG